MIGGVGGAPMPVPLLKVWKNASVALQQGYGMTETTPAVLTLDQRGRRAQGRLCPASRCCIRKCGSSVPTARDADVGELGELWVKGPNVTPGYWNRPDANASSFTDGWLHTGDATRVDEEGFYYIVDRWKDMYISGGENVYPAEVESVLHQLTAIAEAAIIGIPNEQWGEVGMAIVAVKPGHTLTPAGNPRALRGQSGAVQMPAADRVRRCPAAQRDGQDPQADAAKEISTRRRRPTKRPLLHDRAPRMQQTKKPAGSSPAGSCIRSQSEDPSTSVEIPKSATFNRREGSRRWSCRASGRFFASNEIFWPSLSELRPARSTALM